MKCNIQINGCKTYFMLILHRCSLKPECFCLLSRRSGVKLKLFIMNVPTGEIRETIGDYFFICYSLWIVTCLCCLPSLILQFTLAVMASRTKWCCKIICNWPNGVSSLFFYLCLFSISFLINSFLTKKIRDGCLTSLWLKYWVFVCSVHEKIWELSNNSNSKFLRFWKYRVFSSMQKKKKWHEKP